MAALEGIARDSYDRFVGLELHDIAVDCCITKAPCGGEKEGARWIAGREDSSARWPSTGPASR
jgi:hypothetical protein